jgi:hypothetical protein
MCMQSEAALVYDAASLAEEMHRCQEAGSYAVTISSTAPPSSGCVLRACGSCSVLGGWDAARAPMLKPVAGKQPWEACEAVTVQLPVGETVEFKLVEYPLDKSPPRWQVFAWHPCHEASCCNQPLCLSGQFKRPYLSLAAWQPDKGGGLQQRMECSA